MGAPRKNEQQRLRAYHLYRQEFGPADIQRAIDKEFEDYDAPASLRTVKTWVKEFKELDGEVTGLDQPFQWHLLEKYEMPWECSAFVLMVWKNVCHAREDSLVPLPTIRQVRWWCRVHLAVPEVTNPMDVFYLAQRFVGRDMLRCVLGLPIDMRDLEAHLAYKPWANESNNMEYHTDIFPKGLFPPLQRNTELLDRWKAEPGTKTEIEIFEQTTLRGQDFIGPDLLYSQWLAKELAEGRIVTRIDQVARGGESITIGIEAEDNNHY